MENEAMRDIAGALVVLAGVFLWSVGAHLTFTWIGHGDSSGPGNPTFVSLAGIVIVIAGFVVLFTKRHPPL
jgi:hypothetical protein